MLQKKSPLNFVYSPRRRLLALFCFVVAFFAFAWFFGMRDHGSDPVSRTLIVLDTSLSMITQDISASGGVRISRLDIAKMIARQVHTDEVALVTFASEARVNLPFTSDKKIYHATLYAIEPMLYGQSTDFSSVIRSVDSLYDTLDLHVIILTDGENTAGTPYSYTAKTSKNRTYTLVGIGTRTGGPMLQGYDQRGYPIYKQFGGKPAISQLDREGVMQMGESLAAEVRFVEDASSIDPEILSHDAGGSPQRFPDVFLLLGILSLLLGMMIQPYTYIR